jgi:glutathione S-transferase
MQLLQFSTSHYCRKVRLALGYKQLSYQVENLTPGVHQLRVKPLTGLTTLPVLIPDPQTPTIAIGDSTRIFRFLDSVSPQSPLLPSDMVQATECWMWEDWLDESIGTATRFVYYDFRSKEGKSIDPSLLSQVVIQVVRRQYDMTPARVQLAAERLASGLEQIMMRWGDSPYLVGDRLSVADITAAALLSPLALLPTYRQQYPTLFERIADIHDQCREPHPPGL